MLRDFQQPGRSLSVADRAMAATSHPLATLTALEVLRDGGSAADAAVAAVAMQSVVDPSMTGIGGDCFALFAPAAGVPLAINGSGRAPLAADASYFRERGLTEIASDSPHAVTVPGAVAAWCMIIARFGRLGLERVLGPAIAAAENGFRVTPRVAFDWQRHHHNISRHPAAQAQYLPNGQLPVVGDRLQHPALAATLRAVARNGRSAFYEGEVAEDIVGTLRALGGLHSLDDFSACAAFEATPISARYRQHELVECPPNGQGLAALMLARILDGFDLAAPETTEADRIHILAEATKHAYAMRDAVIADPAGDAAPVAALLSDATIESLRAQIDLRHAAPSRQWLGPTHRDTVIVTVVDADRNAISLINSLFQPFGSGIYAPGSGVLLHNRGAGFSLTPGHPNVLAGGKLPFHTIIPAMLMHEGATVMSFGVMGGQYQAVGHVHLLSQMLDLGLDLQMANEAPRSFAYNGVLTLETTIGADVRADLEGRGHRTEWADGPIGGCQSIWIDRRRGVLLGSSDHRKDGMALGF